MIFENLIKPSACKDHKSKLSNLADSLLYHTQAAGIYIAELQDKFETTLDDEPINKVTESDKKALKYIASSSNHKWMINKEIDDNEGIVWKLIKGLDEGEECPDYLITIGDDEDNLENNIMTIQVPDVLTNDKLKFFSAPKLGSFYAVPVTIKSCLGKNCLDEGREIYQA